MISVIYHSGRMYPSPCTGLLGSSPSPQGSTIDSTEGTSQMVGLHYGISLLFLPFSSLSGSCAELSRSGCSPLPNVPVRRTEVGRRGSGRGRGCLPRGAPVGRGLGRGGGQSRKRRRGRGGPYLPVSPLKTFLVSITSD